MKFKSKPTVKEAMQWTGEGQSNVAVMEWTGTRMVDGREELTFVPLAWPRPKLWVEANQSWVEVEPGEWIIKDAHGFYPCKPDIFEQTYEAVTP